MQIGLINISVCTLHLVFTRWNHFNLGSTNAFALITPAIGI